MRELAPDLVYEPGEPSIPVDYRECRRRGVREGAERPRPGRPPHRGRRPGDGVHPRGHRGGRTYIQYWLYYPDSNSTALASDKLWNAAGLRALRRYPGFHEDDWESFQVRIDRDGKVWARASAHDHYQGCKHPRCTNRWTRRTGWTRVSRGSHAGPHPASGSRRKCRGHLRERTSTRGRPAAGPAGEAAGRGRYRPLDKGIKPPWRKGVWKEPVIERHLVPGLAGPWAPLNPRMAPGPRC